tara:strand:+ start:836 stop:2161 length:1326 start_codon:yes stop_codon:yes gene_type:complete
MANKKLFSIHFFLFVIFSCFFYRYFYASQLIPTAQLIAYSTATLIILTYIVFFVFKRIIFVKENSLIYEIDAVDIFILILISLSSLTFMKTFLENGASQSIIFFGKFLLPLLIYFIFRIFGKEIDPIFKKYLIFFSILFIVLILFEGYFQIIYKTDILNWSNDFTQSQGIYRGMAINYTFFDYQIYTSRPRGWSGQPQSSGAFIAIFLLFYLIYKQKNIFLKYFIIFLTILGIYISGSRTALIVAIIGIFFIFISNYRFNKKMIYWFLPLASITVLVTLSFLVTFTHFDEVISSFKFSLVNYIYSFLMEPGISYVKEGLTSSIKSTMSIFNVHKFEFVDILIGINQAYYTRDIFMLNNFMRLGILYSVIFLFMIINILFRIEIDSEKKIKNLEYYLIIFGFMISSLHYDLIYVFPANFIFFACIAILVNLNKNKKRLFLDD